MATQGITPQEAEQGVNQNDMDALVANMNNALYESYTGAPCEIAFAASWSTKVWEYVCTVYEPLGWEMTRDIKTGTCRMSAT